MPGEQVYCCVKGCKNRSRSKKNKSRCLERLAGVKLVEELLQVKKKEISDGHSISTKSFVCEECCPHIPLLGKRAFKMDDNGNACFGNVMEVQAQTETRGGKGPTSHPLSNGSLQYSVSWLCHKTKDKSSTSEFQKPLEKMIQLRNQIEGHYREVYTKDFMRKKVSM
jgi:hypothetical protein